MPNHQEKTVWAEGERGAVIPVTVILYDNGAVSATADCYMFTEHRMRDALARECPGHQFTITACGLRADGYFYATGIATTPTPRPAAADGSGAVNPEIKRDYPDYGGRYG
jgi:hypothetical protein